MKKAIILGVIALILLTTIVVPVYAHPRAGVGVWIGPGWGPWWGPGWWWGPPAYPYYDRPPVIIEQQPIYQQPLLQQDEQNYWYYCPDAKAYYPYVKDCPKGWLKVVPAPPQGKE